MKKSIIGILLIIGALISFLLFKKEYNKNNNYQEKEGKKIDEAYVIDNYKFGIESILDDNVIYYTISKIYIGNDEIVDSDIVIKIFICYSSENDNEYYTFENNIKLTKDITKGQFKDKNKKIKNYSITYSIISVSGEYK